MKLLTIWDSDEPNSNPNVLLWRLNSAEPNQTSVPQYLEQHADRIRAKYLALIHDLGETNVKGKRLVNWLEVEDGFSIWWMSLVAEKSPFKSPRIFDCLLLLSLNEILQKEKPEEVMLISSDKALSQAIKFLCLSLKITYRRQSLAVKWSWPTLKEIFNLLPHPFKAFLSLLLYLKIRWSLREINRPEWVNGNQSVFFFSYFIHLDKTKCEIGNFYSRHWEELPDLLHDHKIQTNWIHIYLSSTVVPNTSTGIKWINEFNHDVSHQGAHSFLESYISPQHVLHVLSRFIKLIIISIRIGSIERRFQTSNSSSFIWPLLKKEWLSSIRGQCAILNLIWIELFNAAMSDIPTQRLGIYLLENQGWERLFIHTWRKHGHGKLVGFAHATVNYWHLNYYDDPRTINSTAICRQPLPDLIAISGLVAWQRYADAAYPQDQLVEVEALRYQGLLKLLKKKEKVHHNEISDENVEYVQRVIILGEIQGDSSHRMLKCIEKASIAINKHFIYTLKSHPSCAISSCNYPGLQLQETEDALAEILGEFDIAIAGQSTSASLEAYLAGLRIIVFLGNGELNLCPLRGITGVSFVSNTAEMETALTSEDSVKQKVQIRDFFWLDNDLPRWRKLIGDFGYTQIGN